MNQFGLVDHWKASFIPPPTRCSNPLSTKHTTRTNERLTLNFLLSAFLVYGVGVVISITVFVLERLFSCRMNRTRIKTTSTISDRR